MYTIKDDNIINGILLVNLLTEVFNIGKTKSELIRAIRQGGLYMNGIKIAAEDYMVYDQDLIDKRYILMGFGKKDKLLLDFEVRNNDDNSTNSGI